MGSGDIRPLSKTPNTHRITAKANNRLGAVFSALDEFWRVNAQNVQKAAVNLGKHADDVETIDSTATRIKASGLPKSFVDAVPKLDAVVSVVDQFADVSLCVS